MSERCQINRSVACRQGRHGALNRIDNAAIGHATIGHATAAGAIFHG
jgi:hypothetical protein